MRLDVSSATQGAGAKKVRILNGHFAAAGLTASPRIEANSVLTLAAFLRTGEWSTVLPQVFRFLLEELPGTVAVPLAGPGNSHTIGLVLPDREPITPSARALAALATGFDLEAALATFLTAPMSR